MTTISLNGNFSDWTSAERIDNPANAVAGYALYGTADPSDYYIGIQATASTDPAIGPGTTIWLNTDQDRATGYSPFSNIGTDYNVTFDASGIPYLYTGAAGQTLASATPFTYALSSDSKSLEIAIPRGLLTPASGPAPTNIDVAAQLNVGGSSSLDDVYLPSDYTQPEYTITDPATLASKTATHKVAIVYSGTSASLWFSQTAYSDLFMAAQNQARMAGVSYDVIDESQLTTISNLVGYDALIFPAMPNVNTAQLPAIMSTLTSAVQNYHVGIITSGDFLTNDQVGQPLPGNAYSNMQALLGLSRVAGGNGGTVTVTASDVSSPIMQGYAAGETIHTYANVGYTQYQAVGGTPMDVLVNQNVSGVGTLPGVVQTTTGGTNVHFATANLLGDSNLLSNVIEGVVLGTQPAVSLHISRDKGIVAARMDMDQSQFPAEVSPDSGAGIYDKLIPILRQWNQNYDFVGSFFFNIGDVPPESTTDWSKTLPYYQAIEAMGSEIGTHSYTHLINPPTITFTATTTTDTPAGSATVNVDSVPSFAGSTVGLTVTGPNIGTNTLIPSGGGEGGAVANTMVSAVSGNTLTLLYVPGGFGGANEGVLGDIPAGTTLTFAIPAENTNFLQAGDGTVLSGSGHPFTYDYELNQPKAILQAQLGHPIYGAAIPGANEAYTTSQNILPYFQSGPGYTGYLTGGWTGIGSGYPSAIGYMNPTSQGSVYIAPNMTFDFTEIGYQGKTPAQAAADWAAQVTDLSSHADGTPVFVWPIHDYGAADWDTTDSGADSPYTTQMYTDFIAHAFTADYEFVTLEDLASRIAVQEKASINYTTSGNTVIATVTPDATSPDFGEMALSIVNGGTEVIQNVTNWYAYNSQELFLPRNGGTFTVNLGATQDSVTHIASLPMRADLLSVAGDGRNISFSVVGQGNVLIDLGAVGSTPPTITGATISSLVGNQLTLTLTGSGQHDVTVTVPAVPPTEVVSTATFSADSGTSASDFVTSVAAQTISGGLSAPLAAGDMVKVSLDNGATWQTATATAGGTTFSLTGVTLTASNTLVARVENANGLASTALSQAYVLDMTAPAEPTVPDLTAASDDGLSNTDNITSVTTPTFTGTAEPGSTVTLYDGTTVVGTAVAAATGNWSVTTSTVATGTHSITAKAADVAGNVSVGSAALAVTIVTVPAAPSTPDLAAASDSGASSTDNITKVTKPTFTGTAQAGSTVTLFDGATAVGTGIASATGSWSITTSALADGIHSITATATNVAGNVSAASAALSVTIDTTIAALSAPDLTAASDKGASNTDNITNLTRPTFTGTAEAGSTVTLLDGPTVIGTGKANAAGMWTITSATLAAGTPSNITAKATDVAGNVSAASPALAVTIDTTAPAVPSAPDLVATSDSGVSNTDNITNLTTPTFTGTAEAGSTVTLYNGATALGTGVASATGTWTISTSALANGTRNITAKATDVAGNVSAVSPALAVTIDTSTATPGRPDLVATSDSGVSNTDNITSLTTPTFTGIAEAGSTVTLLDGTTVIGTSTTNTARTWTITAPALANGTHSIIAKTTDVAGNLSAASPALSVTIDTQAPSAPGFTGGNSSTLTGKGQAGATVSISDGSVLVGTATVGSGGTWGWAFIASASPRTLTAIETDKAGNVSPTSGLALIGSSGADTLTSTANSLLIGGAGADTFSFNSLFGKDVIADFVAAGTNHDRINFHGSSTLNSFASVLSHTTQVGTGVVISQDASNTLTLNNVSKSSLTSADFIFV